MDLAVRLASIEATLADADAELSTDMGGHRELTSARVWRGQVLVDWEPDPQAGGCLLRPDRLRRLIALHAHAEQDGDTLRLLAPGRVVAGLSPVHADLVTRLGGAARVELRIALRFQADTYLGGQETYALVERGQRVPLLRLVADVRRRPTSTESPPPPGSPSTSPART